MTNYEVMFIVNSTLDDAARNEAIDTVKGIISDNGTLGDVDEWGMRKLAYPIEKKNEGYYVVIEFQAEPTVPKELDRRLKIMDAIIRHIIVNKDEK
ncbi:MAG: 30S ribosomal protein S6 [Eubacteriaceae bacterium]|jgi:ribosomal protein S6|nr:30S ribosomal protein S6 [Eubacteriaceae bacterium]